MSRFFGGFLHRPFFHDNFFNHALRNHHRIMRNFDRDIHEFDKHFFGRKSWGCDWPHYDAKYNLYHSKEYKDLLNKLDRDYKQIVENYKVSYETLEKDFKRDLEALEKKFEERENHRNEESTTEASPEK